jgi:hypothetical protein
MDRLWAGTGRRVINPELGMPGPGIRIYCDPIVHIERDLMVISSPLAHEVRQAVARAVGTEPSHVLVNYRF